MKGKRLKRKEKDETDRGEKPSIEMTPKEAADWIGLPLHTFRRWLLSCGRIPHRRERHGGRIRIYLRREHVEKTWGILCRMKGVPPGTKLEDITFAKRIPKAERVELAYNPKNF